MVYLSSENTGNHHPTSTKSKSIHLYLHVESFPLGIVTAYYFMTGYVHSCTRLIKNKIYITKQWTRVIFAHVTSSPRFNTDEFSRKSGAQFCYHFLFFFSKYVSQDLKNVLSLDFEGVWTVFEMGLVNVAKSVLVDCLSQQCACGHRSVLCVCTATKDPCTCACNLLLR